MKITLLGSERLRLDDAAAAMTIEAASSAEEYTPFHMLAGGLAYCVHGVLSSWARQARLDVSGLAIEVTWEFTEDPHRIGRLEVSITWPGLPEQRRSAAVRAAGTCAVHATLTHPPAIDVRVA